MSSDERRRARRERAQAAVLLALAVVVVLWTPIVRGGYFAPADVVQQSRLLEVEPNRPPSNALLADPALQHVPFLGYDADAVERGRLPLWNPYNAGGVPHLANYQSAALSPFSWPFYVFSFRVALWVSAFLKLYTLALFAYLFGRRIGLRHSGALAAAVGYGLCGYHLVWLSWAHVGAEVVLPAGLYAVECALQARGRPRRMVALCGVALAVAAGLLAGHPETFFFASLLLGAYVVVRVAVTIRPWRVCARRAAELLLAAVGGLALAAVQLLPFLEYASRSTLYAERSESYHYVVPFRQLPLIAFPNLSGSPALGAYRDLVPMNFNETAGNYIGLVVIFLALFSLVSLARRWRWQIPFFLGAAIFQFCYLYNVAGVQDFAAATPILRLGASVRSHSLWTFSLAILAGYGVDALRDVEWTQDLFLGSIQRYQEVFGVLAVGGGLLGFAWYGAGRFREYQPSDDPLLRHLAAANVAWLSGCFIVALIAVLLLRAQRLLRPARKVSRFCVALLVLTVFGSTGPVFASYNPTVPERLFYPTTPVLDAVSEAVGTEQAVWFGRGRLPAQANLWYRLHTAENYDALGIKTYDDIYSRALHAVLRGAGPSEQQRALLRLLGVRYIVAGEFDGLALTEGLPKVANAPPVTVFAVPDALPRYSVVGGAYAVRDQPTALGQVTGPGFDPRRQLVLEGRLPAGSGGPAEGTVTVISEEPERVRLQVTSSGPGWLLALQSWFPGWQARVDGGRVPLLRANAAFTGVPVPSGTTTVTLVYRPASVNIGSAVSLLALVDLLLVLVVAAGFGVRDQSAARRARKAPEGVGLEA